MRITQRDPVRLLVTGMLLLLLACAPSVGGAWLPLVDGGQPDPPLTLFGATRRNAARTPRLA